MKIEIIKNGSGLEKDSKHDVSFANGKTLCERGFAKCTSGELKAEKKAEAKTEDPKKKVDSTDLLEPSENKLETPSKTK